MSAILRVAFTFFASLLATVAVADSLRFQAVWHSGTGTNLFSAPEPLDAFLERGADLTARGLRLVDVETARVDGMRVYAGVWIPGSGGNILQGPMGPVALREAREARAAQGLRLVDIEVFRARNGGRRYIGVWRTGAGRDLVTGPLAEAPFLARGERLTADGLRLVDVEVERVDGRLLYTGLWRDGSGANLFVTPRNRAGFEQLRDEMRGRGLELVDVERVPGPGQPRFVGVFAPGSGEGILTRPRRLGNFLEIARGQTEVGRRTRDVEMFAKGIHQGPEVPEDGEGTGGGPTAADLPDIPAWIELSSNRALVIDFGVMVETATGGELPRMTIPRDALPDWLPLKNDGADIVLPDKFCGMNISMVSSISWQLGEQIVEQPPFNHVPDLAAIEFDPEFGNQNFLQAGIEFTGPIGGCEGSAKGWFFPIPITQTGPFEPLPNIKLVLDLMPGAEIRFLDKQFPGAKPLDVDKLFSDKEFLKMEKIAQRFIKNMNLDGGYCGIDQYLEKICKDKGQNDPKCLVGNEFGQVSPC